MPWKLFSTAFLAILLASIGTLQGQQSGSSARKSFELLPSRTSFKVGEKIQFSVAVKDPEGRSLEEKPTIWFAVPFDLAAVDVGGNVSFYHAGQVTIGALVSGKPVFTIVTVSPAEPKTITIIPIKRPLLVGGTTKLEAETLDQIGDSRQDVAISWTSDDPSIASIDEAGVVTGRKPGRATLKAAAGEATATIVATVVTGSVEQIEIQPATAKARTGDVIHFTVNTPGAKETYEPRWAVSGTEATIDSEGRFVAEAPGNYVVTASIGKYGAAASVLVLPRHVEREMKIIGRAPLKGVQGAEQWIVGNYAYFSTIADRFFVYDISDPANPKLTDTIKVDARIINDISTTSDGKILVISREGASNRKNGIAFFDTSDPAHPKPISEFTETVTGGVHSAFIDGHYVYLTDDATGSMRVIDFSDVKSPKEVARWEVDNPTAAMMQTIEGERVGGRYLHDIYVKDGLAYLAYWRDGLVILDVGNGVKAGRPDKPIEVSQFRFNHTELYGDGWVAGSHAVFRYKHYVFVGDEVLPASFNIASPGRIPARGIVHVIDVSDLDHPRKVAEYPVPEAGSHNIWVADDVLYMGYYSGGGRVVDVSGELLGDLYRQGREIGKLWTGDPAGFRANLPFTWGAQPHKDMVVFNDINSGLWIVKLGRPVSQGSTTTQGQ